MKPSQILARAAEIHAEHGHCKGSLMDAEGHVCALGAITLASMESDRWVGRADYWATEWAARAVKHTTPMYVTVPGYNDDPTTSAEDITLLLKRAAADAAEAGE